MRLTSDNGLPAVYKRCLHILGRVPNCHKSARTSVQAGAIALSWDCCIGVKHEPCVRCRLHVALVRGGQLAAAERNRAAPAPTGLAGGLAARASLAAAALLLPLARRSVTPPAGAQRSVASAASEEGPAAAAQQRLAQRVARDSVEQQASASDGADTVDRSASKVTSCLSFVALGQMGLPHR